MLSPCSIISGLRQGNWEQVCGIGSAKHPEDNSICQHLASLGYVGAADLKRRIEQTFAED